MSVNLLYGSFNIQEEKQEVQHKKKKNYQQNLEYTKQKNWTREQQEQ